jgi:alpha-galactosidase
MKLDNVKGKSMFQKIRYRFVQMTFCAALSSLLVRAQVSQTPPMGFNSYDCLSYSATEDEMKAIADTMAKKYQNYGWEYVCIDWCWSYPGMSGSHPNQTWNNNVDGNPTASTRLTMDAYGRLMPDTVRHPSSKGAQGFKPLADYIHAKGLKFGIHIMRGIPRQAVYANTPIYGSSYRAGDAANKNENCAWLNQMYGLNFNSPAARAYLSSIFSMYAAWGVDYIKIDDLMNSNVNPRTSFKTYIQAYREAIDSTHRPMVFSTSPGATPIGDSVFIRTYANQWRMADDLWDNWSSLNNMIDLCSRWYPNIGPGHFPDADMIPIGYLSQRGPVGSPRWSGLTGVEQRCMMTVWCIARSPLIWGGDVRKNRAAEDSLMTNPEVIEANQRTKNNRTRTATSAQQIWTADHADSAQVKYVAFINRSSSTATMSINLATLGLSSCTVRDCWARQNIDTVSGSFSRSIPGHGAGLFRLTVPQTGIAVADRATLARTGGVVLQTVISSRYRVPSVFSGNRVLCESYDAGGRKLASFETSASFVDPGGDAAAVRILKWKIVR